MRTADDILNLLGAWVGFNEKDGTHKVIIDIYNTQKPLPRGYKMKYTDAWCAAGLSAAAIATGMPDLIGTECGCEQFVDFYKKKGIWNEDGNCTPSRGWVILFNWDDTTQPNDGYSDHIGIVERVENGKVITLECNCSDSVKRRTIPIGKGNIRGYGMIQYEDIMNPPTPFKSNEEIATEVINGLWGNSEERKIRLTEAGYSYAAIQKIVDSRLAGTVQGSLNKTIEDIAKEVIRGKWGNGATRKRRLEEAGYNYKTVQSLVNKMLKK